MQNSYVHSNGGWHLVNNTFAHADGGWHLVKNGYVHSDGQWHLTKSLGSNLDQTYDTPGEFTYKVPDGVYNLKLTYPTPSGLKIFGIPKVTPGQEIPIRIGEYGTTSSVTISTSTYVLPAFDVPVLSLVAGVEGWMNVEFSAATPTAAAVSSDGTNESVAAAAVAAGESYILEYAYYAAGLPATMNLTPIKSETIINWPNARIHETRWGGRNHNHSTGQLTPKDNSYIVKFQQNDDPEKGWDYYKFGYNIQQILKVTVSPAGTGTVSGSSLIVTPSSFSVNAVRGTLFTQQFNVSGGTSPYTWATSAGAITSGGLWSYTPPAAGTLAVTITATSANGLTGTITPTLNISGTGGTGGGVLALSSSALASGQVGVSGYSTTVTGSGGTAPYQWTITGNLPQGLSGSAGDTTYTITGTPQLLESQTFTLQITDVLGQVASRVYTITIAQNVPVVSTASLPSGTAGTTYSTTSLAATGGTSPYTYNITLGSLPSGLTMTSAGVISGTPTVGGTANFSVAATDSGTPKQTSVAKQLSVTVAAVAPTATESLTITTPFVTSPFSGYPSPFRPTITYNNSLGGPGGDTPINWYLKVGGVIQVNGGATIGLTNGSQVIIPMVATTGTYDLLVTVPTRSISQTLNGILII
jgi:hypothetical protein